MTLQLLRAAVETWVPGRRLAADPLHQIRAAWTQIVGEHVAAHCDPAALNGTTLLIATRTSAWSQQLQFLSPAILAALTALAAAPVSRLNFRTGGLRRRERGQLEPHRDLRSAGGAAPRPVPPGIGDLAAARPGEAAPAANAAEALARLRARIGARRAVRCERCVDCEAPLDGSGQARCAPCTGNAERARLLEIQRLVYLAPWLTLAELREQLPDLAGIEFEHARRLLLQRWWLMLERARRAGRLSASGIERHVASSYVLLQSRLPPDRITAAIASNLLGPEVAALIAAARADPGRPSSFGE